MTRSWIETSVDVPHEAAEAVANFLFEVGSPGLVTEESGARQRLVAYLDSDAQVGTVRGYLAHLGLAAASSVTTARISSASWAESWKEHFPPLLVGERLYLCPPWAGAPPAGRAAVVIDPGMAFGTGHHATTRTCLELLERHLQAGCALLDVGTGSGVLAIAALRLGAERAVGVDVDPLARAAAAANAARNGVADRLRVRGSLDEVDGNFAAATANLQLSLLVELETRIAARLLPDGLLVASGLLREEIEAWRAVYAGRWREVEISGDREWVTVASHRRKSGCGRP